jgi:hypothetical protein
LSAFALSDEETVEVNGRVSLRKKLFVDNFASSNAEQFSAVFDMRLFGKAVFEVLNLGVANALKFTLYGAVDPNVKWEALPNAVSLVVAASASKVLTLTDAYGFVRVGVISNVAGSHTSLQVLAEAKNR